MDTLHCRFGEPAFCRFHAGIVVDNCHQGLRHAARIFMLDDVSAIHDPGGALLHQRLRAAKHFFR